MFLIINSHEGVGGFCIMERGEFDVKNVESRHIHVA
jgi:hypothetical protein